MFKRVLALTVLLSFTLAHPVLAASQAGNGSINGLLVNKTAGGGIAAGQGVSLEIYQKDALSDLKSVKSGSTGEFSFDGLQTDIAYTYELTVTYQESEYRSKRLSFGTGQTSVDIEIPVYEATTESTTIRVMMSHVIVNFENNSLLVKEYYLFVNDGDRTFIGKKVPYSEDKRETLRFSLPAGATDFQSNYGMRSNSIIYNGSDFSDTMAVPPGMKEVSYSYRLPCNSSKYTLSWQAKYAINRFDLLLSDQNIRVSGDKLTQGEPLSIAGNIYQDISGVSIASGDIITAGISNLPVAGKLNVLSWAWLIFLPIIGGASFIFVRKKKLQPAYPESVPDSFREELLAEIAELDDSYENEEITKEEYVRLRSEKKQQLKKLLK